MHQNKLQSVAVPQISPPQAVNAATGLQESTYLLYNNPVSSSQEKLLNLLKTQNGNQTIRKFLTIFNSQFDASLILLPFIFHRAGWATCTIILVIATILSYFCCILVYESTRLLTGNFKLKQKIDYETLLSSQMAQKSLAVSFTRQLYLIQLICMSSIGIIFSIYAADSLFVQTFKQSFALQLVPEAKIVYDNDTSSMPFNDNYFCITVGLMIVFAISLVLFAFDFEKESWFQPLKTCSIISFLTISSYFFIQSMSESLQFDSLQSIPEMTLNFGFALGILAFSSCQSVYIPIVTAHSNPQNTFRSPVQLALLSGLLIKIVFGTLGAIAYEKNTNLFDNLMFSNNAPYYVVVSLFIFTVFSVLPVVVRSSLMAKYFIYIGGMCEVPCNYFSGIILPWIFAAILNHLQIYVYLVNWFTLATGLYVYFVCPMFMWSKSIKEATIFENNFKQSLQMICDGDYNKLSNKRVKEGGLIEVIEKIDIIGEAKKTDGMPIMEVSISGKNYRGFSTSKYLLNDEEDDKLSSISEMFEAKDDEKFIKVYNMQGHYSATQSVRSVFPACCSIRCARRFVKMVAYIISALIFVFMYLSLIDAFSQDIQPYEQA